jgi:hypothetical protein
MLYVSKMNRGIKSTRKSGCELEWTDAFPRYTIGLLRHGNVAHWGWDAEVGFCEAPFRAADLAALRQGLESLPNL